jgi:exodeoxyribonuclease VII small subunit
MTDTTHSDVMRLPFERAIEELESIVKRLEEGKVPLEESVAIYERGEALKRRCEELLRLAEENPARRRRQADRNGTARRPVICFSRSPWATSMGMTRYCRPLRGRAEDRRRRI